VPLPAGVVPLHAVCRFFVRTADGQTPVQTAILDRWPDGSARWMLADFQADVLPGAAVSLEEAAVGPALSPMGSKDGERLVVRTGAALFRIARERFPFETVSIGEESANDPARSGLIVVDEQGTTRTPKFSIVEFEDNGPVRTVVRAEGCVDMPGRRRLEVIARLHFFAGMTTVRVEMTVRNPHRAQHRGGFWELGDPGSLYVSALSFRMALPQSDTPDRARCSLVAGETFETFRTPFALHQESSGGDRWRSTVHVNRRGTVPLAYQGYRLTAEGVEAHGQRATPIVRLDRGHMVVSMTTERFWENFPRAIRAEEGTLCLDLLPRRELDLHEIQGGEQKTHSFFLSFDRAGSQASDIEWCRRPSRVVPDPDWCSESGAIPFLIPRHTDPQTAYHQLVDGAIDGDDSFVAKREAVDEYGWRDFGEIYADHEAVFEQGPQPLVSHYNNQYDAVAGMVHQFLSSGDARWWPLLDDLARHVIDIDIYHTKEDWPKYNHGLFWHTVHYKDAGRSTHRTYPKTEGVPGGGPSAGHLYTTGLLLHHFLTGSVASREAVVDLATFVIDSDDGAQSMFRWLDRGRTGYATASGSADYHGPGRATGNALNALVDAHRLTGESRFLEKADEIIRRAIHPDDDIEARHLLDAERRWFYTMFLQSLGKYLWHKRELGQRDAAYAYGRASLLAYTRWMVVHERPYLDRPETLEYPNETWAAQDMRKSEVFKWAALEAGDDERRACLERARFFFDYAVTTLSSMSTRTLARPVILLLSFGWSQAWFERWTPPASTGLPDRSSDFGTPHAFVPQKARAIRRAKMLLTAGLGLVVLAALAWLLL
jgi:hypothetical protein